jgi:hypothetical protein
MPFTARCTIIRWPTTCEGIEGKMGKPYGVALSQVEVPEDDPRQRLPDIVTVAVRPS